MSHFFVKFIIKISRGVMKQLMTNKHKNTIKKARFVQYVE